MPSSPQLMDFYQIWFRGSSRGRNQLCGILWQSAHGFRFCEGSKFAISHWLGRSPLTQCWRYRAACDKSSISTRHMHACMIRLLHADLHWLDVKERVQYKLDVTELSSLGRRSFAVAGPTTSNSLSADLRDQMCSEESFRRSLKHSCSLSTSVSSALEVFYDAALYKSTLSVCLSIWCLSVCLCLYVYLSIYLSIYAHLVRRWKAARGRSL